ncbi:dethiobiotin synthase [Blastomonas sp.]|uniref:dethiobiotin synthase n=1 Tax=Blastomonas sp. TaxID=1909299 RepID=UPI002614C0F6|nr:dethiobiotin synthase [Blastomonas sp.]MDM7956464.1 dethiobiotin synthase [Blastomonas sp.]
MKPRFVVTGTDTDIGKSVFSAALVQALAAKYWKPVQSGLEGETDTGFVERMVPGSTLPEAWRLVTPASPHLAAEIDGVEIDPDALTPPAVDAPLIIEGAGGALVPVTRAVLYADVFARWQIPVIVCARTALGTINHSLMTIEALRSRGVPIHGVAFIGDAVPDSEATIAAIGKVRRLGRLARLAELTPQTLATGFDEGFSLSDFT